MKRLFILLISAILLLTGCTGSSSAATETTGGSIKNLTLTLVTAGRFGDGGAADAIVAACAALPGVTMNTMECGGKNHTDRLLDAAMEADLVVLVGQGFEEVETIARDFRSTRFILVDGTTKKSVPNILTVAFARNEGAFLAGYAAAKTGVSGTVGIICDENTDQDQLLGFRQGVSHADPGVTIEVFQSEPTPAQTDVIYDAASGVLRQGDTLCAVVTDAGAALALAVEKYMTDGASCPLFGTTWLVDLSSGLIRVDWSVLPLPLQEELDNLKQKIAARVILVDTAR